MVFDLITPALLIDVAKPAAAAGLGALGVKLIPVVNSFIKKQKPEFKLASTAFTVLNAYLATSGSQESISFIGKARQITSELATSDGYTNAQAEKAAQIVVDGFSARVYDRLQARNN